MLINLESKIKKNLKKLKKSGKGWFAHKEKAKKGKKKGKKKKKKTLKKKERKNYFFLENNVEN